MNFTIFQINPAIYGPIQLIGFRNWLNFMPNRFFLWCATLSGCSWHSTGKVTLLLVFRGINVNERVSKGLENTKRGSSGLLRPSSEAFESFCTLKLASGFEMASLFFIDKELFSDSTNWALVNHVPISWCNDCTILSSLADNPENLLSMFTIPVDHIRYVMLIVLVLI